MYDFIITGENIKIGYGACTVLNGASIHVGRNDIYGLVGKNGAGKTTLLRILSGLIPEYSGKVTLEKINGHERRIAVLINDPSLFLTMNAYENMKVQALLLGINEDSQIKELLKTVGLADSKNKLVKNFSLGMVQRLKLAMALLQKPDILILDEPMNGLDPDGMIDLRDLLMRLHKKGMTILISSHLLSELEQMVTRFGILHDGKIINEIVTDDVLLDGTSLESLYMQYTRGEKTNGETIKM